MSEPVKGSPEWIKAEQAKVGKSGGGKGCFLGCLGLIGAIVLFAALFAGCGAVNHSSNSSSINNSTEAIAQCESRIGQLLKAPSTAEYTSDASGSGAGPWTVTGTVDADNSFGAKIRSSYQCTVTMSGDMATTTVDSFTG